MWSLPQVGGVATAYAATAVVCFWPGLALPFRQIGLSVPDVLRVLVRPAVATLLMTACVVGLRFSCAGLSPMLHLVIVVFGGAVSYILASLWVNRKRTRELLWLVLRSGPAHRSKAQLSREGGAGT